MHYQNIKAPILLTSDISFIPMQAKHTIIKT